jgi:hypothetical protein
MKRETPNDHTGGTRGDFLHHLPTSHLSEQCISDWGSLDSPVASTSPGACKKCKFQGSALTHWIKGSWSGAQESVLTSSGGDSAATLMAELENHSPSSLQLQVRATGLTWLLVRNSESPAFPDLLDRSQHSHKNSSGRFFTHHRLRSTKLVFLPLRAGVVDRGQESFWRWNYGWQRIKRTLKDKVSGALELSNWGLIRKTQTIESDWNFSHVKGKNHLNGLNLECLTP